MQQIKLEFITPGFAMILERPLMAFPVSGGFLSPADDFIEGRIDLKQHLVQTPNAAHAAAAKAVAGTKIRRSQGHAGPIPVASTTSGFVFLKTGRVRLRQIDLAGLGFNSIKVYRR